MVNQVNFVWSRKLVLKNVPPDPSPKPSLAPAWLLEGQDPEPREKKWSNCNQSLILQNAQYLVLKNADFFFVNLKNLIGSIQ